VEAREKGGGRDEDSMWVIREFRGKSSIQQI
jgi:hypothetical protein